MAENKEDKYKSKEKADSIESEQDPGELGDVFTSDFGKEADAKDLTSIEPRDEVRIKKDYGNYYSGLASSKGLLTERDKIINELKKYAKKETNQLEEQIKDIKNSAKETKERLEDKIDDSKLKIIETLGIFVALFTFISIEFQVFRSYESVLAIAGLTLIILGALTFFVVILDFILNANLPFLKAKKHKETKEEDFLWHKSSTWGSAIKVKSLPLIGLSLLFILLGAVLFTQAPKTNNLDELEKQVELLEGKVDEVKDKEAVLNNTVKNTVKNSEKEKLESEINQLQATVNCLKIKGYFSNQCF